MIKQYNKKKKWLSILTMINYDDTTKNINEHNPNWLQSPHHRYIILITGGPESRKANVLLNQMKEQDDDYIIDKIYWYVKDPNEAKCQYLIKKHEKIVLEI